MHNKQNTNLTQKRVARLSVWLIFIFLFSGCANSNDVSAERTEPELNPTFAPTNQLPSPEPTQTPEIVFTPTPDTRLTPEQWQTWPIIPEPTNRSKEIYLEGIQKGVNPYAFSKIGDCQNVKESFMGIYDTDRYFLQDWQSTWQETVNQFVGYFNRDSLAFGQGLNVAMALSPFHADPNTCLPTESPIQCELRVINPAFAFVRFERWYPGETPPEVYEKYLRQILDEIIAHGTVPILMTKADNVEGNHQINYIIAKVAYDYDLPLYNWWLAAQSLPNNGIDPERDDKFHIDPIYAWTEQSIYGLGALDSIWKGTSRQ